MSTTAVNTQKRICAFAAGYNKQMPLYYDQRSGSDPDWPMISVGWQGFADRKLSAEQVVSLALDQIGQGTPEQDEVAALLANTDPSDWQTIDRYLEQIIGGTQFDRTIAVRRWRLSEFKHFLRTFPQPIQAGDESLSAFEDIYDFWLPFNDEELPEDAAMIFPHYGESVPQMLAEQQAWVEREEIALCDEMRKHYDDYSHT